MTDRLLTDRDLMEILGRKKSWFYREKSRGRFRHLEVVPQLTGRSTRYSPEKVAAWRRREPGFYAQTFGRRKAS